MKPRNHVLLLVLLATFTPRLSDASSAVRLSFDQLVAESNWVVSAAVEADGVSAWAADHHRIFTTFSFQVEEELLGTGPRQFTVTQPGGAVGRLAQKTHGFPTFHRGDRVLLFLRMTSLGYRVVGLSQGVFGFEREGEREFVVQRLEGLDFPWDAEQPVRLERKQAFDRIRGWSDGKGRP